VDQPALKPGEEEGIREEDAEGSREVQEYEYEYGDE